MSRAPLLLALLATPLLAQAQHDPHAHHAMTASDTPPVAVDPHAGHVMAGDPHAGHSTAPDPHAGHAMTIDPPAAQITHPDPHAGHVMPTDPHAGHATPAATLPRTPIPVPSEADRAAAFPVLHAHAMPHGASAHHLLRVDRLEAWDNTHGSGQAWELQGWWGSDTQRLWLRAEGERETGTGSDGHLDLFYGQSTGPWWDALVGLRQEHGHTTRTRAAIGLQGLAPYRIETRATVLLGGAPHAEAELAAEYSVLLSNRLILTPSLEATALLRDDPLTARPAGLASVEAGLRLRYEITRRVAPYVGVEREWQRDRNDRTDHRHGTTRWVAGLRLWF